jgi:HK97 family phage prohead protease
MDATLHAPTDNLVRLWANPVAAELRSTSDGKGNTLVGHFAVFDTWTEINSMFEGNFLERIAPGAFSDTFTKRGDQIRVLYDHGMDPTIGNKPLGAPNVLKEDRVGAYYEVDLFDASYVNDLKPALRAGQLGASFRFRVTSEEWNQPSEASSSNPSRLEERTITGIELYEFGPVTFPAYSEATAGLRSSTDTFIDRFVNDTLFLRRFIERAGPAVADKIRTALPPTAGVVTEPAAPTARLVPVAIPVGSGKTVTVKVAERFGEPIASAISRYYTTSTTADGSETGDNRDVRSDWVARHVVNPPERPIAPTPVPDEAAMAEADARRDWVQAHVRHLA